MTGRMAPSLPLLLAILLVASVLAACGSQTRLQLPGDDATPAVSAETPAVGQLAPDFTLRSTSGDTISLSDLRGHVVLVNFWATWCAPCKQELPAIDKVARRYAQQGFVVLGVDDRDQDDEAIAFARQITVSFPLLLDSRGATASRYHLVGVPTSFLIDRNGVIRAVHPGPYTERELDKAVRALLSG